MLFRVHVLQRLCQYGPTDSLSFPLHIRGRTITLFGTSAQLPQQIKPRELISFDVQKFLVSLSCSLAGFSERIRSALRKGTCWSEETGSMVFGTYRPWISTLVPGHPENTHKYKGQASSLLTFRSPLSVLVAQTTSSSPSSARRACSGWSQ